MNYSEAQIYMESLERGDDAAQPDGIGELFRRLDCPRENVKYVYAPGVKGAAAAFVVSILRSAGIKTGHFLPREDVAYGEQILVGRRRITRDAFCEGVELVKTACEEMMCDGYVCPDAKTAMKALAFWYFDREGCQAAVLEDEPGNPGSCLHPAEPAEALHIRYGLERQTFDYKDYKKLEISLAGKEQIDNALLAMEIIESLRTAGFEISEKALYRGLKETTWPGSFEILHKKPIFILDDANNGETARELARSIGLYFENKRIIYIVGMLQSDETAKVISRTAKYADMILTVTPQHPQALHSYELARQIAVLHPNVTAVDSLEESVEISFLLAGKDDVIIAFGTPALQGRLTAILAQKNKKK